MVDICESISMAATSASGSAEASTKSDVEEEAECAESEPLLYKRKRVMVAEIFATTARSSLLVSFSSVRARLREVRESASKGFETRERPSKNFRDDLAEGIQSYV